jgi:hypothetical protein
VFGFSIDINQGTIMADDKTKPVPADAGRINMGDAREIRYWMEKLGCTKEQLVNAVGSVGPTATKVQTYLKRK